VTKQFQRAVSASAPAYAVVGQGGAHSVYDATGQRVHRLRPVEELALQGFTPDQIQLQTRAIREQQTLVGNGWPASFGHWLAACVAQTLGIPPIRRNKRWTR
jgi:hypothetical protein